MTKTRGAEDRTSFLRSLKAVRSFLTDPIPDEVVDDILRVARWSGSASNKQPWEIIVIRNRDMLEALATVEGYADHLAGAPLGIVLVMAGDRAEQEAYDEGRLAERIMLAAWAHGVGSSIGWIVGSRRTSSTSRRNGWCGPRSPWATRTRPPAARARIRERRANPSPR